MSERAGRLAEIQRRFDRLTVDGKRYSAMDAFDDIAWLLSEVERLTALNRYHEHWSYCDVCSGVGGGRCAEGERLEAVVLNREKP